MSAEQAEVLDGLDVYPLEVHGLRIGPLGFIGVPLEPFIELGRAIAAGSPFAQTFVSGYTNGYRNYLPDDRPVAARRLRGRHLRVPPGGGDAARRGWHRAAAELAD